MFQNQKVTMFANKETYVIHRSNKFCQPMNNQELTATNQLENSQLEILDYIKSTFPKQKHLILAFNIFFKHNLIDSSLYFTVVPVHFADVCRFLNNPFGKIETTDALFIKLCKYLHTKKIKFPKISIKNPVAQKFLC